MSVPRLTSLTCQRHQAQRAQVCLGVENAGETSLVATGVYQAPPLGSVSKGQVNPVGQSGRLFFIKWKYFIETFNSVQVFPANCIPPLPLMGIYSSKKSLFILGPWEANPYSA